MENLLDQHADALSSVKVSKFTASNAVTDKKKNLYYDMISGAYHSKQLEKILESERNKHRPSL